MAEGYHDFSAGEDLTAANLESYCEAQSIMRFASSAARDTALSAIKSEGMFAYTLDTNTLWMYNGSAWTAANAFAAGASFTPNPLFGAASTNISAITSRWNRMGRFVWGSFVFSFTGAPNTGNFTWNYPVNSLSAQDGYPVGLMTMSGAGTRRPGFVEQLNTSQAQGWGLVSAAVVTGTSPVTWANADFFRVTFNYEAAAD